MVVPRGWDLWSAGVGEDGTGSITFEAPQGWTHGWENIGTVPACMACMWGATNGLIPAAFKVIGQDFNPPVSKLIPTPQVLMHPNPCIAVLRYKPKNSPLSIRAVVLFNDKGNPWERDLYLALPEKSKVPADYILKSYRMMHSGMCNAG